MRTLLVLMLVLAVGCGIKPRVPRVAKNQDSSAGEGLGEVPGNMKKIILAMHDHMDAKNCFPHDSIDPQSGRMLLSWRVHLLPYLGEGNLYQSFKLNEPWDSPTNSRLVNRMPRVFAANGSKARAGETYYRGFAGEGAAAGVFETGKKIGNFDIHDGMTFTIAVIDAGEPVIWTKPGSELSISPNSPLPKLGGMSDGNFCCVLCDGTVRKVRRDFDEMEMRAAISCNGGEVSMGSNVFLIE